MKSEKRDDPVKTSHLRSGISHHVSFLRFVCYCNLLWRCQCAEFMPFKKHAYFADRDAHSQQRYCGGSPSRSPARRPEVLRWKYA